MTFIIGKLVWALVQPGNLLLLCLLAGVFLLLRGRRRGELPVVLSAIGFLLLAVAPIGPAMMLVLEQRFPRPPKLPERIDGILVLGGAVDQKLSLSYGETVFNGSVARVLAGDRRAHVLRREDRPTANLRDHVARLHARGLGRAAREDIYDHHPADR